MKRFSLFALLGLAAASTCIAGGQTGCAECGCNRLKKVCRVVPEVKKVTATKWVVECEEICIPGKSRCEERLVSDPACVDAPRYETVTVPTCDRIVTRKKLKKVTTTTEKPSFKCVVDTVCCQCGGNCTPCVK